MRSHILITGNGCNMSSPLMETLLLETLMDDWNSDGPDLAFWIHQTKAAFVFSIDADGTFVQTS